MPPYPCRPGHGYGPLRFVVLLAAVATFGTGGLVAQEEGRPQGMPLPESADPVVRTLQRVVEEAYHPGLRWPEFPFYQDELVGIYRDRDWELLWVRPDGLAPAVGEALDVLAAAEARGLRPDDYDADALRAQAARLEAGELSEAERALFDAALTVAMLRHLSDLHIGRVNPANLHFGYEIEPKKLDLAAVLVDAVGGNRIRETVARVEPTLAQYEGLKAALATYRNLALDLDPRTLPDPGGTVHLGEPYTGAEDLARFLTRLGDLRPGTAAGQGGMLDSALVAGLESFQWRHGLDADGVLGPATLEALRTPLATRVGQIEMALERIRWLPEPSGRRFIIVNIPVFQLWAYDGDPNAPPALSMPVVVGRALRTETPAFFEEMEYVVLSPYWNLPWGITINEVLPRMRQEPDYLRSHNMEALPASGGGSATQTIDDALIERIASGAYRLRQRPGPGNALGRVKFIFPNARNIYLHDTPSQGGFDPARRDFSHGCVRVGEPTALAEWVLADRPEWGPEEIRRAMSAEQETRVDLEEPMPVLIFYTTAMVWLDGRITFRDDIYGHDAVLERTLEAGYPYAP